MSDRRSALAVSLVALALAITFVTARVGAVGWDGFVAAGKVTAEGSSVFTYDHYGYDGQFFYRLALEPFSTAERVDGIAFDAPAYRQQRIGYPLIAWGVNALTPLETVQALVLVNLAALGILVYQVARLAQRFGHSPAVALLVLTWPALIFSLGLDLSEIVALALAVSGLRLAMDNRHAWSASFLTGAALTRETTVLLAVVAFVVYRRHVYALPVAVLFAWQAVIWVMWEAIPGVNSLPAPGDRLLTAPLLGLIEGAQRWGIIDMAVAVCLLVVVWIGFRSFRSKTLLGSAFLAYGALALLLGSPVWESWRGFARASVEFALIAFLLRLSAAPRPALAESDR